MEFPINLTFDEVKELKQINADFCRYLEGMEKVGKRHTPYGNPSSVVLRVSEDGSAGYFVENTEIARAEPVFRDEFRNIFLNEEVSVVRK